MLKIALYALLDVVPEFPHNAIPELPASHRCSGAQHNPLSQGMALLDHFGMLGGAETGPSVGPSVALHKSANISGSMH